MNVEIIASIAFTFAIFVSVAWRALAPPRANKRTPKRGSKLHATGHGFGRREYWRRKD